MERKITKKLINWKNSTNRKPLIIRGARQVGKTYSIHNFGKKYFEKIITIDFEKKIQLKYIFDGNLDTSKIIESIEVEINERIIPGKHLLFFDEVQRCPRAIMSLRYFYEDMPDIHVIAAGSLLELEMDKNSFPVGRVDFKFMFPLTFDEFLLNIGENILLEKIPDLSATKILPETIHQKFIEKLKLYFIVGGMPEAVVNYINSGSLQSVFEVHENLYNSFVQDILKYEKKIDIDFLETIFEEIPKRIGNQIKFSNITSNISAYKLKQILHVLEKALLIHKVKSTGAHGLPLGKISNKKFKYIFIDIGFLQYICGIPANEILKAEDILASYHGALCEQFIGQELIAYGGSQHGKLYYWSRDKKNSSAEIDYLLVKDGKILPIEVKKGPAGKLKSMRLFLNEHPEINNGYVFNSGNIGKIEKIKFFPLYTKF